MTQSRRSACNRIMVTAAAILAACILVMGCSIPAYAKVDPGWNGDGEYNGEQAGQEGAPGNSGNTENNGNNEDNGEGTDKGTDNGTTAEPGFSTPGNGNLGDQIKSSGGKDFYTVHTKNNNTFYLVIDHSNSTENVYMLSLIDENDLAEFLKEEEKEPEKAQPPVIIPQTQSGDGSGESAESKPQETPPARTPAGFSLPVIFGVLAAVGGILYYFLSYRPKHKTDEEDYSEGIETGDGFDTEREE